MGTHGRGVASRKPGPYATARAQRNRPRSAVQGGQAEMPTPRATADLCSDPQLAERWDGPLRFTAARNFPKSESVGARSRGYKHFAPTSCAIVTAFIRPLRGLDADTSFSGHGRPSSAPGTWPPFFAYKKKSRPAHLRDRPEGSSNEALPG